MKIKTAINRIFWRFGGNENKKPFPVNQEDVNAYNSIDEYIKQAEKQQCQQNENFAKLYTYLFMKILENDKSTVMDNLARKKIYSLLKKPLYQVIEDFKNSLNDSEQYEALEASGASLKHPLLINEQETADSVEKLKEFVKTPENKSKLLGEVWDFETVKECIEAEINQALNLFK
jgi:hypothetical protein